MNSIELVSTETAPELVYMPGDLAKTREGEAKAARVLPKRVVERLAAARAKGRSFRDIEATMAKTIGVKACNGTAAMRLCRIAGIK